MTLFLFKSFGFLNLNRTQMRLKSCVVFIFVSAFGTLYIFSFFNVLLKLVVWPMLLSLIFADF